MEMEKNTMTNFKIFAHPNLGCATSGKASDGHHPPVPIGKASSLEVATAMILSWVCLNEFTGAKKAPFAANTDSFQCNVWPLRSPAGELWYIAAHRMLEAPINQEVNA
jgi:hypothetical protein